ncbi:hypothetical protein [Marinicella meishanensis]|uniref:hypothetical protein n=1 Tax=Marinicella meishanensis TaxID=2873263 RepID=UPI001CC0FCCA|nr:hypothetical protein [Marinicella sp. NBU2979]
MIEFLKHKKFWLPLVILSALLLMIEGMLRAGWYDRMLSPLSHMGNTVTRLNAFERFGLKRIHWVTLGDSKMDWGIDHGQLRDARAERDINHLRLSLAGSNFLATHTAAEWSIDHLPELQGIMLGLYEHEFVNLGNTQKEFKITWPFKDYWQFDTFDYFRNASDNDIWLNQMALQNYAGDIKDWVLNPLKRHRQHQHHANKWSEVLDYSRAMSGDLCAHDLSSLASCINSASQFKNLSQVPHEFVPAYKNCSNRRAKARLKKQQWHPVSIDLQPHAEKWRYLFDRILQADKQLTLLLLPENEFFEYMVKPSNIDELVDALLLEYLDHPNFQLIDLRELFAAERQCQFYYDTLHFNNEGIQRVTEALIEALNP